MANRAGSVPSYIQFKPGICWSEFRTRSVGLHLSRTSDSRDFKSHFFHRVHGRPPPSPDRSLPSPTQPLRLMTAEEVEERRAFLRQSKRPSLMRRCSSKVGKVMDGLQEWAATEDVPEAGPSRTHHAATVKQLPMPNTSATRTLNGIPVVSLAEAQAKVKANPLRHAF
ncbi:hypothetical protein HII31_06550 [Pseudocercospora fuligena]|uniref:Uncharacterized protein n=1 Tax=Pseudocercospora fuligena TaxID=685502 RepID=A0A8H6VL85_9PEZI|nr:hypothetical protein HII31_06550 [Pseudocercospora fuligena]